MKGKEIADSPSSGIMLAGRCTFWCHHTLRRHGSGSSIPHLSYRGISRTNMSKRRMVQKSNEQTHLIPPHPFISRKEVHPRGNRGFPLSCTSCWFDNAHRTQLTCIQTSSTYRKDNAKVPTILRLRSITRGCNHHISSKQYETPNPQQHIIPIRTQVKNCIKSQQTILN